MIFMTTLLSSLFITILTVPFLSPLALRFGLVDVPNGRKMHSQPIPQIGGLAIALGAFAPIVYWIGSERFTAAWLGAGLIMVLFGLLDDYYNFRPRWKLLGQLIAAFIVIYYGGIKITTLGTLLPDDLILPLWISVPLTFLTIIGVTNAINLADGLDGLAGGVCLLSIACIGYLAYLQDDFYTGLIALALCGAIFGFLRFNTHPAKIFMGDAGSQFLGFSAITLALSLTQGATPLSPLLPLIILGFPVLDTLTVMIGRIKKGVSPFIADRTHFHHNLMTLGLYQSESVLAIYTIQVVLIISALVLRFYSDWILLIAYVVFSGVVLFLFSHSQRYNLQIKELTPLLKIKSFLHRIRYSTTYINYLFRPMKGWLLIILIITSAMIGEISVYFSIAAVAAIIILLLFAYYSPKYLGDSLRTVLYLIIPAVIYLGDANISSILEGPPLHFFNLSFAILALLTILVSKLTKRKEGFKSTPMDFLILFIVVIAPNLPDYHLGMIAGKIIICYFGCEVLMAELRGNFRRVLFGTLLVLSILSVQGLR